MIPPDTPNAATAAKGNGLRPASLDCESLFVSDGALEDLVGGDEASVVLPSAVDEGVKLGASFDS